jgi:hypothetical protein
MDAQNAVKECFAINNDSADEEANGPVIRKYA